eukprot:6183273-Pleurochrysis_carterae.AAC.1
MLSAPFPSSPSTLDHLRRKRTIFFNRTICSPTEPSTPQPDHLLPNRTKKVDSKDCKKIDAEVPPGQSCTFGDAVEHGCRVSARVA